MIDSLDKIEYPCPICGSAGYKIIYVDTLGNSLPSFDYTYGKNRNQTYRIVRCSICSHCYCSPRPRDLHSNYIDNYIDSSYLKLRSQRIATARRVIQTISKLKKGGKLLDIGCATGDFMIIAKETYQVDGLELATWSAKIAEQKGLVVHKCQIKELPYMNSYDIVTLWGVIEHFEFPASEIFNICNLLKDDGIVCIWTGDIDSITSKLLRKRWWYFLGQHLQYFSRKSMCQLFENNGFRLEYMGIYPYVMTCDSFYNSMKRYSSLDKLINTSLFRKLMFNLFKDNEFTLKIPGETFAIFKKQKDLKKINLI